MHRRVSPTRPPDPFRPGSPAPVQLSTPIPISGAQREAPRRRTRPWLRRTAREPCSRKSSPRCRKGRRDLAAVPIDAPVWHSDPCDDLKSAPCAHHRRGVVHRVPPDRTTRGRGRIDQHQTACSSNFALDQTVFAAALAAECDQVAFASSACVYPTGLQSEVDETVALSEEHVGPPYDPDGVYGMAKLAGERRPAEPGATVPFGVSGRRGSRPSRSRHRGRGGRGASTP